MNDDPRATLEGLRRDPANRTKLYEQLFSATLMAAVEPGSPEEAMTFFAYAASDGVNEVPIFTSDIYSRKIPLPDEMKWVPVPGKALWPQLLNLLQGKEVQAAVDPATFHGIRLTHEMVLEMVSKYKQDA